jgi:hypothetical protein
MSIHANRGFTIAVKQGQQFFESVFIRIDNDLQASPAIQAHMTVNPVSPDVELELLTQIASLPVLIHRRVIIAYY